MKAFYKMKPNLISNNNICQNSFHQCVKNCFEVYSNNITNKGHYYNIYNWHIKSYTSYLSIEDVNHNIIQHFINQKLVEGCTYQQLVDIICVFNSTFEYAIHHHYISHNPCMDIKLPNIQAFTSFDKSLQIYTKKDIKKLNQHAFDCNADGSLLCHHSPIFIFILNTGLTASEVLKLRWSNIVERNGINYALVDCVNNNSINYRIVPLNSSAMHSLDVMVNHSIITNHYDDYIVSNDDYTPVTTNQLNVSLENICLQNNIYYKGVNALIHTFVIHALQSNISVDTIAKLLGDNANDVYSRYNRVLKEYELFSINTLEEVYYSQCL